MRIDEELLREAVDSGQSTLRFYEWETPTISLGYFQKDAVGIPPSLQALPIVRRLSGGGAILHDQELTYSIAVARHHKWAQEPSTIYYRIHRAIIKCLGDCGLNCDLRGDTSSDPSKRSFLCFNRSDPNDIVVGANKIVGSAQRRRKGCILQHGSILLRCSKWTPDFPGILDLGCSQTKTVNLAELIGHEVTKTF